MSKAFRLLLAKNYLRVSTLEFGDKFAVVLGRLLDKRRTLASSVESQIRQLTWSSVESQIRQLTWESWSWLALPTLERLPFSSASFKTNSQQILHQQSASTLSRSSSRSMASKSISGSGILQASNVSAQLLRHISETPSVSSSFLTSPTARDLTTSVCG